MVVALQEKAVVSSACRVPQGLCVSLVPVLWGQRASCFLFPYPSPVPVSPVPVSPGPVLVSVIWKPALCACAAREHSLWPLGRLVHTQYGNDVLCGHWVAWCVHGARTFSSRAAGSSARIRRTHGMGMSSCLAAGDPAGCAARERSPLWLPVAGVCAALERSPPAATQFLVPFASRVWGLPFRLSRSP